MLNYHVKSKGAVFEKGYTKKILTNSIDHTRDWALNKVRSVTPVKTGNLRAGWQITAQMKYLILNNNVFYGIFVLGRTQFLGNTLYLIQEQLKKNLQAEIKNSN